MANGARTNEERLVALETTVAETRSDISEVKDMVKLIGLSLNKRPAWAVVVYITLSTTLNGALVAALVSRAG